MRFFLPFFAFVAGYVAHWVLDFSFPCGRANRTVCEFLLLSGRTLPWQVPREAAPVNPREALTVTLRGDLAATGLDRAGGAVVPPGEGAQQLFDEGAPVEVTVTLAPADGEAPLVFELPDGGFAELDEGWRLSFAIAVGAEDPGIAESSQSSATNLTTARFSGNSITLASENNTAVRRASAGDAFGYIELIHGVTLTSETMSAERIRTGADFQAFLRSATTSGGRFEFRFCDESLARVRRETCPDRSDFALPFATNLSF